MNQGLESVEKESNYPIERNMRPSGMLFQRKENMVDGLLWLLSPRFHPSFSFHFDELKNLLARDTRPKDQRLCFQASEKDEMETFLMSCSCFKDLSKLLYMCCPATPNKVKKMEGLGNKDEVLKSCEAIAEVRAEVDKLSLRVSALQTSVQSGLKVDEKEFLVSTELLMVELLKLDGIEAEGEAKIQRKNEVRRIQGYLDKLDSLKARNSNNS